MLMQHDPAAAGTDDKMTNWQFRKPPLRQLNPSLGLSAFVPKGLNDRSQAIYCLEWVKNEVRPVGNGVIRESLLAYYRVSHDIVRCTNNTVPTGRAALLRISQAMNCLATIIQFLRNKCAAPSLRLNITPLLHHSITPPLHYSITPLLHRSIP
jgi:hypothetical protein